MALGASEDIGVDVDVCLLVEGTYPYVPGGVSAWVHDIITGHPGLTFSVFNIGSHPGAYGPQRYTLPDHVTRLYQVYCQDSEPTPLSGPARERLDREIRAIRLGHLTRPFPSRVLRAIRRLNLEATVDDHLLEDLTSGDLSLGEFLHGRETFDLLEDIADAVAPKASFLDLFWHFRAIYVPILRLLAAAPPPARCYHTVSTGYAGLCGTAFSLKSRRPLVVTEHGIYSRERNMDLARADWIKDQLEGSDGIRVGATPSPLRALWSRSFRALASLAYHRASRIVTLSGVNRARQIADGALASKISIVANGVDVRSTDQKGDQKGDPKSGGAQPGGDRPTATPVKSAGAQPGSDGPTATPVKGAGAQPGGDGPTATPVEGVGKPMRVGFVGRVVPIKDVICFIKACHLALAEVPLDVRIIGPIEEDPAYCGRCRDLVETLGLTSSIKFLGPQPIDLIYGDLDVVVLTSFSEGQPLVILEAYAASLPVIATDVGACREMIQGRSSTDLLLGQSGFVTRVGTPADTAAALVRMARDPVSRRRMGVVGRRRVVSYYRRKDMIESYGALYRSMVTP